MSHNRAQALTCSLKCDRTLPRVVVAHIDAPPVFLVVRAGGVLLQPEFLGRAVARIEPFPDQSQQHPVAHPTSEKLPQMSMIQFIEELTYVQL